MQNPMDKAEPRTGSVVAEDTAKATAREQKMDAAAIAFLKRIGPQARIIAERAGVVEAVRHPGSLLGNMKNEWLIVGIDNPAGFELGDKLQVRAAVGSHLIAFESEVLHKLGDPRLFGISLPNRVHTVNLRKRERIPAFFPADVQLRTPTGGDTLLLKARVVDIGAGGCALRTKIKVQRTADAKISFSLPGGKQSVVLKGMVIESGLIDRVFHCRVRFTEDPANVAPMQEVEMWVAESLGFVTSRE